VGQRSLEAVTIIVPYYRNMRMLARQVIEWNEYPRGVQVIVVDDGSPEPALPIIQEHLSPRMDDRVSLYRIQVDIPWNREGARNLGAELAVCDWIVQLDIDHMLPAPAAHKLLEWMPRPHLWYRFPRWRVGQADETRQKDAIPPTQGFGQIHPHIDSYLIERALYWEVGGYDEDFAGCLGGGTDFLKRLERHRCKPYLMPEDIALHVHTRGVIEDASDWSLSRDRDEGKRRQRIKDASGRGKPTSHLRFPWERLL
jgi:glycosyl transferase family 2